LDGEVLSRTDRLEDVEFAIRHRRLYGFLQLKDFRLDLRGEEIANARDLLAGGALVDDLEDPKLSFLDLSRGPHEGQFLHLVVRVEKGVVDFLENIVSTKPELSLEVHLLKHLQHLLEYLRLCVRQQNPVHLEISRVMKAYLQLLQSLIYLRLQVFDSVEFPPDEQLSLLAQRKALVAEELLLVGDQDVVPLLESVSGPVISISGGTCFCG